MLFVGQIDARNAQERLQGIKETIAGTKIEILDVRTDDTDRVRAKANVAETLVAHPDVAALVGLWSYNGPAILNAVRDANKIGQVPIITFDEEDETLTGVKSGAIAGTVVQQPFEFGYQAMTLMAKVLAGDRSGIPPAVRCSSRRGCCDRTTWTSSGRNSPSSAVADASTIRSAGHGRAGSAASKHPEALPRRACAEGRLPRRAPGRGHRAARRKRRRQVHADEDRRGIEQPDSGEVLIDGARVVVRDVHTATSHGIAFIHQELNLLDNLDVAGNVLLGREPTGWGPLRLVDRRKMHAIVQPYLAQVGLSISADTAVAGLSIAQQQLVEIAKALSLKARVLIMDEPTSSLTLAETSRLHEIVAGLRSDGVGVVTSLIVSAKSGRSPTARSCFATAPMSAR